MLRHVALVRTDVSEELSATWRNIPEDTILHNHHHENLKSYKYKYMIWHVSSELQGRNSVF
jgi:hypothetical protein